MPTEAQYAGIPEAEADELIDMPSAEAQQRMRWLETDKRRGLNQMLQLSPIPLTAVAAPTAARVAMDVPDLARAAEDVLTTAGARRGAESAAQQAAGAREAAESAAQQSLVSPARTAEYNAIAAAADPTQNLWGDFPIADPYKRLPTNPRQPVPLAYRRSFTPLPYEGGVQSFDPVEEFGPLDAPGQAHRAAGQQMAQDVIQEVGTQRAALEAGEEASLASRAARAAKVQALSAQRGAAGIAGRMAEGAGKVAGVMGRLDAGILPAAGIAGRMANYGDFMASLSYLSSLNGDSLNGLDKWAEDQLSADPAKLETALNEGLISRALYERLRGGA
jgi:hypothetical protein